MKKYLKPMVVSSEELSEGIYMASGACYIVTAYITQKPEMGRDNYVIQVNGVHDADHMNNEQFLHISFNQPVTYISSTGNLVSGNGSNSLCIKYSYHQNQNDNIGLGDLIVESNDGLSIVSVKITD